MKPHVLQRTPKVDFPSMMELIKVQTIHNHAWDQVVSWKMFSLTKRSRWWDVVLWSFQLLSKSVCGWRYTLHYESPKTSPRITVFMPPWSNRLEILFYSLYQSRTLLGSYLTRVLRCQQGVLPQPTPIIPVVVDLNPLTGFIRPRWEGFTKERRCSYWPWQTVYVKKWNLPDMYSFTCSLLNLLLTV